MPRINRVRIVNVPYDDGTKVYTDRMFNFQGKHSLINLANGGGKTLFLQMVIQTVLPNTSLAGRGFHELFRTSGHTSHILVEWILDSETPEYLLTGICATKGDDETGRIKFFMYTNSYKESNPFDIKRIPVKSQNSVTSYGRLQDIIRRAAGFPEYRINYFTSSDVKEYRKHLEIFNLYSKEWKGIQVTNNEEGGISGFFRNCQTSEKVIRNLVIPSISEVIYENPEEEKQVAEAFISLREKLLKIPELEKNIKIFDKFIEGAEDILATLEEYRNICESNTHITRKLWSLRTIIDEEIQGLTRKQHDAEKKLSEVQRELEDTFFQLDSLMMARFIKELEAQESLVKQKEEERRKLKEDWELLDYKIREAKAVNAWIEIKEREQEISNYNELINASLKGNEELQKELNIYSYNYLLKLKEKIKDTENSLFSVKGELSGIEEEIKENEGKKQCLNAEKDDLNTRLGGVLEWVKNYEEIQGQIGRINLQWSLFPEKSLNDLRREIREKKARVKENQLEIETREKEIQELEREIDNKREEQLETAGLISKKESVLDDYNNAYDRLKTCLSKAGLQQNSDIYSEKTIGELTVRKLDFENSLTREILSKFRTEEKKVLLADADFYRPNKDVIKLKEVLTEFNIPCVEGSSWLKEQPITREQKEMLLMGNPLIPYSIIITPQGFRELGKHKDRLIKLDLDYPVPLIIRNEENLGRRQGTHSIVSIFDRDVFVIYHKGYELFVSGEALKKYRDSLESEIQRFSSNIEGLKKSIDLFNAVIYEIKAFTRKYQKDFPDVISREIKNLEAKNRRIQEEITGLLGKKMENKRVIAEKKLEIEDLEGEIDVLEKNEGKLEGYLGLFNEAPEKKKIKRNLENRIKEIDGEVKRLEELMAKKYDEKNSLTLKIKGISDTLEGYRRELRDLEGEEIKEDEVLSDIDFEGIRSKLEGLRQSLYSKTSDIEGYRKAQEGARAYIRDKQKYIKEDLGIEPEALPLTPNRIADIEIQALVNDKKEKQEGIEAAEKQLKQLEQQRDKIKYRIEDKKGEIIKRYNKEPVTEFFGDDLREIEKKLDYKIEQLKEKEDKIRKEIEVILNNIRNLEGEKERLEFFIQTNNINAPEEQTGVPDEELSKNIKDSIEILSRKYMENLNKISDKKGEIRDCYDNFKYDMGRLQNLVMDKFINSMEQNLRENIEVMFDYDKVYKIFDSCFRIVENYKKATEGELERYKKDKEQLVDKAIQQAERFYTEICNIDRFSIVNTSERSVKMVKFEMVELERDSVKGRMESYFDRIINELEQLDRVEAEKEIEVKMTPANLLNVISDLGRCRIRIFKPKEAGIKTSYADWENVVAWSGGEKYTALFSMFITIISYIRSRVSPSYSTSKVILADNPFGKASAAYLLDIIFSLANRNNVQMICATALKEDDILKKFDVVYSLVLRPVEGIGVVMPDKTAELESGYYNIDIDLLEGPAQISMFDK